MTIRRLREVRSSSMNSWPNGWGWTDPAAIPPPGLYSMQRAGVPVTPHTSLQVDVVHTALRVISNAIIKMGDLRGYRLGYDGANRPYRVWLNPQPSILTSTFANMWQYDGRRRTVISLGLFGEAFWYTLTRDYLGFPTAVEVLNPLFVTVDADSQGQPVYYFGTGTDRKKLKPENVTHIPFMAMPGARRGLSSIEYAGVAFALALAAMEYGQRWFSQGASPSFVLTTEQKLGQEQIDRIARKFLVEHSGLQAAHLPLVVDSGVKPQKISSTPDEAQYLGTLEYARSVVGAWFGLPSHLTGGANDKGNVWGKTVQEQGYQMEDYTFSGYTVPMEEAHSSLMPRGQFAAFNESVLTRANAADLAAEITALRSTTILTPNEIRVKKLREAPTEGGDNLDAPLASNIAPGAPVASIASAQQDDDEGSTGGNV